MIRKIVMALLIVGIIGTSYWAYHSQQQKKAMQIHIENNYQRAFHNLVYHMDLLHDKVGTSFVMNSSERLKPQFVDIWKLTSIAQSDVNQLPLGLLPFQHTAKFLAELNDFTYETAIRNLDDEPLSSDEINALEKYYEHAKVIKDELREAQFMTLNNQLQWTDVEIALLDGEEATDNDILAGFRTIEDGTSSFANDFIDNPLAGKDSNENMYQMVKGKRYDEEDIVNKASGMFEIDDAKNISVAQSLDGADIANYNISYADDEKDIFMDMTAFGAYPVTFIVNRPVEKATVSLHDGQKKAEEYLQTIGYEQMDVIQSQQFDNIGVYTFATIKDDVKILTETIGVKVALDTNEVIGLNASEYIRNHQERNIEQPKLTENEAEKNIHENIDIQDVQLVLMENNDQKDILAYMFTGIVEGETYRVFIDAMNGKEEKVERLSNTETNFEIQQ